MANIFSSFFDLVKNKIRSELGVSKMEDEINSIHFLLNNVLDIRGLPNTKDVNLRWLQKCDTILLCIFDRLCEKYGLSYWLDSGSLLGAVRHKGFIPWDDDIDVCMLREDMEKVIPLMKEEVESYGLTLSPTPFHPLRAVVLSYKMSQTGIWLDIFPLDTYITNETKESTKHKVEFYRKFFYKNRLRPNSYLIAQKSKIFSSNPQGRNHFLLATLESGIGWEDVCIHRNEDIYPLGKVEFEGFSLNSPRNYQNYLSDLYGLNYMEFPKKAINNHGNTNKEISIKDRASANGINMEEVYNFLYDIYLKLSK